MKRNIMTLILIAVCFSLIGCSAFTRQEDGSNAQDSESISDNQLMVDQFSGSVVSQTIEQMRERAGNLETDAAVFAQIDGVDIGYCGLNFEDNTSAEAFLWGALYTPLDCSDFSEVEEVFWHDSCVTLVSSVLYGGGLVEDEFDYMDEYYRLEIANDTGDNWIVYDVLLHLNMFHNDATGEWESGGEGTVIASHNLSAGEIPQGKASFIGIWVLDSMESDGERRTAEEMAWIGYPDRISLKQGGICTLSNSDMSEYGEWEYRNGGSAVLHVYDEEEEGVNLTLTPDGQLVCMLFDNGRSISFYYNRSSGAVAMAQIDGCDIYNLAVEHLGTVPTSARELFLNTYICIMDDMDSYWSIVYRDCNATYTLISSEVTPENMEYYTIEIAIDDPFMLSRYTVYLAISDDYHLNELQILSNETTYKIHDVTWDSSEVDYQCLKTVVKPDGVPAISSVNYSSTSGKEYWYTIDQNQVVSTSDGYYYDVRREPTLKMYSDGRIYYWGDDYYPRGYEKAMNTIELTSGNAIGNSSSNTFNRSSVAYEDGVMICKDGGAIVRFTEYGERYTLHPESLNVNYSSLNLIDGVLYYCQNHESVIAETLNGDYLWGEKGDCIIADASYAYFIDYNEGLFRRNLTTGKVETVMSAYGMDGLSSDGSHIYWLKNNQLYAASSENSLDYQRILDDTSVAYYIAEIDRSNEGDNCSILIYATYDEYQGDMQLRAARIDWSRNAAVTDLGFIGYKNDFYGWFEEDGYQRPYLAYSDGWIYYYYDSEIVCRRNLQGTVIDEFLGYNPWGKCAPLYIFDNKLFLHSYVLTDLN